MRRMILSAFFFNPQGDHRISWRHPKAPSREVFELPYFQSLAAIAEAAKLDALFVADHVGMWDTYESNVSHYANPRLEPITLLSALAAFTSQIGLLATAAASYSEPYNLARMFPSRDHISHGRAGWNVVTSSMPEEAMNFGLDGNIDHGNRYERAAEYLDIVKALWDSIEDDAILLDRDTGLFSDPKRIHRINHAGKYFKVRDPLNVPRPPGISGHRAGRLVGRREDPRGAARRCALRGDALHRRRPALSRRFRFTPRRDEEAAPGSQDTARHPSGGGRIARRGSGKTRFPADSRP